MNIPEEVINKLSQDMALELKRRVEAGFPT